VHHHGQGVLEAGGTSGLHSDYFLVLLFYTGFPFCQFRLGAQHFKVQGVCGTGQFRVLMLAVQEVDATEQGY
jgi:hypothetical protein